MYDCSSFCHLHPLWLWNTNPACWLWGKDLGLQNHVSEETFLHPQLGAQDQWLGAEWGQHPCGFMGTSSGNCQRWKLALVRACHMPTQSHQKHPSGHLGGWMMLWSAEQMLDWQHERVDLPAHARTAHEGPLQKRLEENLCWIIPHVPLMTQSVKGLNWTELSSLCTTSKRVSPTSMPA